MEMECYICGTCGHKYNPRTDERSQNLNPGIEFSDLPADWTCPVCFAAKNKFTPE